MTKRIDWDLMLSKFNESSLSVREFAKSEGISDSALYKKLRECNIDNTIVEVSNIPNHGNTIKVMINGNSLEYPCYMNLVELKKLISVFKND